MKPWETWQCPFPWGEHPAVIVSNAVRVARKQQIVVLPCSTMRPATQRAPIGCEALLDEADGMGWSTLCKCDLLFTIDRSILIRRLGEVGLERRRDIATKIQQGLALAGL